MNIPRIETRRLLLRPWSLKDEAAWFTILQEPDILRYFPNPEPPPRSRAGAYIKHHLEHWERYGYGHWAVVTPKDGRVIGWNGLEYLPELDEVEVAYLLSRETWGRGYATEVVQAAIRFGFETAALPAIIGLVHPDNLASIRVLEKCGLTFVDDLRLWRMAMRRYRIERPAYDSKRVEG